MNASNVGATQRGEVNEQHQNATKHVVQRDPIMFFTIHQTPQTSTQLRVMNVHNDGNHEPIQPFDEVVSIQQPWQSTIQGYYLPRKGSLTLIATSIGFQINHQTPTSIWYPLTRKWNDSTYSIGWSNFITLTEDPLIN